MHFAIQVVVSAVVTSACVVAFVLLMVVSGMSKPQTIMLRSACDVPHREHLKPAYYGPVR
jgi:hypothetical protein